MPSFEKKNNMVRRKNSSILTPEWNWVDEYRMEYAYSGIKCLTGPILLANATTFMGDVQFPVLADGYIYTGLIQGDLYLTDEAIGSVSNHVYSSVVNITMRNGSTPTKSITDIFGTNSGVYDISISESDNKMSFSLVNSSAYPFRFGFNIRYLIIADIPTLS